MTETLDKSAARQRPSVLLGVNHAGLRERNERLVLSLIRRHGALPKSEIARASGLSAQTVSVIMRALEEDGLLVKCEPVRGRVGQPSVPMDLNPDGAFFLGLKIGRRSTEMVLSDFRGSVRASRLLRHDFPDPDRIVAFAREATQALSDPLPRERISGLGIGLPFQLWDWASALNLPEAAMIGWRDRDIRAEIAEGLPWPVLLENDASAACNAELVFGTADLPRNFLYAFIGFFIGGGLVLNGSLFAGATGNAGALASVPVPDVRGGAQQLVEVASLVALESMIGAGGDRLWDQPDQWDIPPGTLDAWIRPAASGLAHAATAAVAVCDLDALVIEGWMPRPIRDRLAQETDAALDVIDLAGIRRPRILCGTVGAKARSLGAASLPLSARFQLDGMASG